MVVIQSPHTPHRASARRRALPYDTDELVSGDGCRVVDASGAEYVDLTSGVGTVALGHGHPDVVNAMLAAGPTLTCFGGARAHPGQRLLAERLSRIAPEGIERFLFATTGAEAVELGLRLARAATGRDGVVAFRGGFHGRTAGASAASTGLAKGPGEPPPTSGTVITTFPAPRGDESPDEAVDRALADLARAHRRLPRGETAAYLIEPVQGVGGCRPVPTRFLRELRGLADRSGALLVADEIQTGMGRCGAWFATEILGVRPDVLVVGKALGAGLPLSAVGAPSWVVDALGAAGHRSTFGGHPLSCATALAGISVTEKGRLLERAARLGRVALAHLAQRLDGAGGVVEIRGLGLMLGIQLSCHAVAARVAERARGEGVLVLITPGSATIRLLPPIVIAESELREALDVVCDWIRRDSGSARHTSRGRRMAAERGRELPRRPRPGFEGPPRGPRRTPTETVAGAA